MVPLAVLHVQERGSLHIVLRLVRMVSMPRVGEGVVLRLRLRPWFLPWDCLPLVLQEQRELVRCITPWRNVRVYALGSTTRERGRAAAGTGVGVVRVGVVVEGWAGVTVTGWVTEVPP